MGSVQQGRHARCPTRSARGPEFYGKAHRCPDAAPSAQRSAIGTGPTDVDNAGLDSDYAPSVATTTDNGSRIATAEWAYFMSARRSVNVRYLHMHERTTKTCRSPISGYLPPFDPDEPGGDGSVHRSRRRRTCTVGANQFTNIQNYRRHEMRGTFTQFFDIGGSSHALKAGAGYEFGEEEFNRLANGWGIIVNITAERRAGAARALLHAAAAAARPRHAPIRSSSRTT